MPTTTRSKMPAGAPSYIKEINQSRKPVGSTYAILAEEDAKPDTKVEPNVPICSISHSVLTNDHAVLEVRTEEHRYFYSLKSFLEWIRHNPTLPENRERITIDTPMRLVCPRDITDNPMPVSDIAPTAINLRHLPQDYVTDYQSLQAHLQRLPQTAFQKWLQTWCNRVALITSRVWQRDYLTYPLFVTIVMNHIWRFIAVDYIAYSLHLCQAGSGAKMDGITWNDLYFEWYYTIYSEVGIISTFFVDFSGYSQFFFRFFYGFMLLYEFFMLTDYNRDSRNLAFNLVKDFLDEHGIALGVHPPPQLCMQLFSSLTSLPVQLILALKGKTTMLSVVTFIITCLAFAENRQTIVRLVNGTARVTGQFFNRISDNATRLTGQIADQTGRDEQVSRELTY